MKKLYENIEDIHIKGGVSQLTELVTAMDISLQNIADYTNKLCSELSKYSESNKGTQYEKVVNTSLALRDVLFDSSEALNDMQNQIVMYQNKIYRYEDMAESAQAPNQYLVNKNQNINVETTAVQFNRDEMIHIAAMLRNYSERVIHHAKTINEKKNTISSVWLDSQYKDFSEFVEDVIKKIVEALKVFDSYTSYLEEKIKELQ